MCQRQRSEPARQGFCPLRAPISEQSQGDGSSEGLAGFSVKDQVASILGFLGLAITILLCPGAQSSHRQYVIEWAGLSSNKTLFTKQVANVAQAVPGTEHARDRVGSGMARSLDRDGFQVERRPPVHAGQPWRASALPTFAG